MDKFLEIEKATCLDGLLEISKKYRLLFGVWAKEYDEVVELCLKRYKQIYGVDFKSKN